MASTFSDLKIQLMATGENSGTWGDVTNVNLGTALEEAITGSADVAFSSADVTLPFINDNETQAARNLRLNLTGTSGGARNLIVPTIEKVYIINNGLADTVTVKNAAGTGIAVPTGKTMYVYNNGTNVVDAITHLTSLTTGVLTSTSTTVLNGTTIPASKTLVDIDSAQTLTNKTLTSPAITTPTGIVKGDVGLGNVDNTSDATKNSATATLTNKTLTSPAISSPAIASPTVTGDLSIADKIVHTGDTDTAIRFPAADTVTVETNGAERVRVTSDGNVGIGTSSPSNNLTILGTTTNESGIVLNTTASGVGDGPLIAFSRGSNTSPVGSIGNIRGGREGSGGFLTFSTVPVSAGSPIERLRIESSGNVGIGTSSVSSLGSSITTLDVVGANGGGIRVERTGATSSSGTFNAINGAVLLRTLNAVPLLISTNNAERMRIDSSGNVGIGTSSPAAGLEVRGTGAKSRIRATGVSGSAGALELSNSAQLFSIASISGGGGIRFTQEDVGERLRIDASGNVGIGTSSPSVRTEISGSEAAVSLRVNTNNNGVSASNFSQIQLADNGTVRSFYRNVRDGSGTTQLAYNAVLAILSDAGGTPTERARIDSSGNLLVGTTSNAFGARIAATSGQAADFTSTAASAFGISVICKRTDSNGGEQIRFTVGGSNTRVGFINSTASATSYVTSSDYRLKEDAKPVLNPIDRLMQLKPINFAWKVDGSRTDGFLAHEAQAVVPEAVTGTKDAVETVDVTDKEGKVIGTEVKPVHQGIDQSKLVPLLTAALQDAIKRIEQLELQINSGV